MGRKSKEKLKRRQAQTDKWNQFIPSKVMDCPICGKYSIHLIIAPKGFTPADVELLAEKMKNQIETIGLTTWVIGQPEGIPTEEKPIHILQVYPKKGSVETKLPHEFNQTLHDIRLDCSQHRHVSKAVLEKHANVLPDLTSEEREAMEVLVEAKQVHDRIHTNDPVPQNDLEEQAELVLNSFQDVIMGLIMEGKHPRIIQDSLLYFWLYQYCVTYDIENYFDHCTNNLHNISVEIATRMQKIAHSIQDEGPDENMKQLGAMLEKTMDVMRNIELPTNPHEVQLQVEEVNIEIVNLVNSLLGADTHPVLIMNMLLYRWLRQVTITEKVGEDLFHKLERNWPEVLNQFNPGIKEYLQKQSK